MGGSSTAEVLSFLGKGYVVAIGLIHGCKCLSGKTLVVIQRTGIGLVWTSTVYCSVGGRNICVMRKGTTIKAQDKQFLSVARRGPQANRN